MKRERRCVKTEWVGGWVPGAVEPRYPGGSSDLVDNVDVAAAETLTGFC